MMSAVRRRLRQLGSTVTVKGSTKGAETATQRRVIDMHVADIYDVGELFDLLVEADERLGDDPDNEQAKFDREDILDRIEELVEEDY